MQINSSFLYRLVCIVFFTLFWLSSADATDWQIEMATTENLMAQARASGGLWRDTEKLLSEAKKLRESGKNEDAISTLLEAKQQAELAYRQAVEQSERDLLPYYLRR